MKSESKRRKKKDYWVFFLFFSINLIQQLHQVVKAGCTSSAPTAIAADAQLFQFTFVQSSGDYCFSQYNGFYIFPSGQGCDQLPDDCQFGNVGSPWPSTDFTFDAVTKVSCMKNINLRFASRGPLDPWSQSLWIQNLYLQCKFYQSSTSIQSGQVIAQRFPKLLVNDGILIRFLPVPDILVPQQASGGNAIVLIDLNQYYKIDSGFQISDYASCDWKIVDPSYVLIQIAVYVPNTQLQISWPTATIGSTPVIINCIITGTFDYIVTTGFKITVTDPASLMINCLMKFQTSPISDQTLKFDSTNASPYTLIYKGSDYITTSNQVNCYIDSYSLVSGDTNIFTVNPFSGAVYVQRNILPGPQIFQVQGCKGSVCKPTGSIKVTFTCDIQPNFLTYPSQRAPKQTTFYIGDIGIPSFMFIECTSNVPACGISSYNVYDSKNNAQVSTKFQSILSNTLITVSCIVTDCEKKTGVYSFDIKVTNAAGDFTWYTVGGMPSSAPMFTVTVSCNPNDKISRISQLPTEDQFPYLFKNFVIENNLAVLNLTFNILSPPVVPHTIDIRNMFQHSNSRGCQIAFYQILQVIDNLSNKSLTTDKLVDQLTLNSGTGNLNIFRFNRILDYSIFLQISIDGTNWLAQDLLNTRYIRLQMFEDRFSLKVNSAPHFVDPQPEIKVNVNLKSKEQLEALLPEVIDNENDKIFINIEPLPNFLQYDVENKKFIIKQSMFKKSSFKNNHYLYTVHGTLQDDKGASMPFKINFDFKQFYDQAQKIETLQESSDESGIVTQDKNLQTLYNLSYFSAYIHSVSVQGKIIILFNETLAYEGVNISQINSSNTEILILSDLIEDIEGFNATKLSFTWYVVSFHKNQLVFQLVFSDPLYISLSLDQDTVQINLTNSSSFLITPTNRTLSPKSHILRDKIRPQLDFSGLSNATVAIASSTSKTLKYTILLGFMFNFIGAKHEVLIFIFKKSLSVIVHFQIFNLRIPANVSVFLEKLIQVVMFDYTDFIQWTEFADFTDMMEHTGFFKKQSEGNKNDFPDQANNLGYVGNNFIINLKFLSFIVILSIGKIVVFLFLKVWVFITSKRCGGKYQLKDLKKQLFFKSLIAITVESMIELQIGGYLSITSIIFKPYGETLSYILAVFTNVIIYITLPILILVSVAVKKKVLKFRFFKRSLGQLWEDLKINQRFPRLYYVWHWVRRVVLFLILVLLIGTKLENVQLVFNSYLNLLSLIFIGLMRAFNNLIFNRIDLFNEFMICLIGIQLSGFSDMVENVKTQFEMGWLLILQISFFLLINFLPLLQSVLHDAYLICYKYYAKQKNRLSLYYPEYFAPIFREIEEDGKVDNVQLQKICRVQQRNYEQEKKCQPHKKKVRIPQLSTGSKVHHMKTKATRQLVLNTKQKIKTLNMSLIQESSVEETPRLNVVKQSKEIPLKGNQTESDEESSRKSNIQKVQDNKPSLKKPIQVPQMNIEESIYRTQDGKLKQKNEIQVPLQNIDFNNSRAFLKQTIDVSQFVLFEKTLKQISDFETKKQFVKVPIKQDTPVPVIASRQQTKPVNILDIGFEETPQDRALNCSNLWNLLSILNSYGRNFKNFHNLIRDHYHCFFVVEFNRQSFKVSPTEKQMIFFILENPINDIDSEAVKINKKKKYHEMGMDFSLSLLERQIDFQQKRKIFDEQSEKFTDMKEDLEKLFKTKFIEY